MDISKVSTREKLKPRREPYWLRLDVGRMLGYRQSNSDGGAWLAKYYDPETRKRYGQALGTYGHLPAHERYGAAKRDAEHWFERVSRGGTMKPVTVNSACEIYAKDRPDAAQRFRQFVYDDPIANVRLDKLTRVHVRAWRQRLEAVPARVTRSKNGTQITRPRSAVTVNRDMVPLRAALNMAKDDDPLLTDFAWKVPLRPTMGVGRRRDLYLDRQQRKVLLEHLPLDAAEFVRGLCSLPLRPGALAALKVGDFDTRNSVLLIDSDKTGQGRKIKLPPQTAALLKRQSRSKHPAARLFTQADGRPWSKDYWKGPVKAAVRAAGLPSGASAYTLRHSTITDLVTGGLDLLTIAQISGTSVRMIELHYGHLLRDHAAAALSSLVL